MSQAVVMKIFEWFRKIISKFLKIDTFDSVVL